MAMTCLRSRGYRQLFLLLVIWAVVLVEVSKFHDGLENVRSGDSGSSLRLIKVLSDDDIRSPSPSPDVASSKTLDSLVVQKLFVHRAEKSSQAEIVAEMTKTLPRVPIDYWLKHKNKPMYYKNETCARLPSIFELEFNNVNWQTLHTTNGTFQLYGAYYDVRNTSRIGPAIRILAVVNMIEPTVKTYCQFWFDNVNAPVLVKTMDYKCIWPEEWGNYEQGIYQLYLISCQIPQKYHGKIPVSVSMVERPCDTATNNVKIIYDKPAKKKGFAVCVKGLDVLHEDLSVRLVEWIELLNILGAEKIFFYELQVHRNISNVLRYYEQKDQVSVTPLTLPGGQPNIPGFQHLDLVKKVNQKRQNELIPYNDCLYKNLYTYEYIAVLDIDEVIMPVRTKDWRQLMDVVIPKSLKIKNESRASYNVRNIHFLDDLGYAHGWFKNIPKYMHMLQHVHRSKNSTKPNHVIKCFHNPERALTLHNYFPLCLDTSCTSYSIEQTDAQLQNYRADCVHTLNSSCVEYQSNSIKDTIIWRYKDKLIARATETLRRLGFFDGPPWGVAVQGASAVEANAPL